MAEKYEQVSVDFVITPDFAYLLSCEHPSQNHGNIMRIVKPNLICILREAVCSN